MCRMAGLELDPWQEFVLEHSLGERADGKWSAFEIGVDVSRQNGKGTILEARELTGAFLIKERLIIHSAHQFDTSLEAFRRLLFLIESTPDFDRRVMRVSRSHGEEGIELRGGQRIRFRTRTKGGGRGFSGDCLMLDEPMFLPESAHGALLPTLSARPNPQVWYTGSAVDRNVHPDGVVFARIRERGIKGDDARLAYFEWSADFDDPSNVPEEIASDPEVWADANPGLGIRISEEHIRAEKASMHPRTFAVERLGIGDWPPVTGQAETIITPEQWRILSDPAGTTVGSVCFAVDVTPDRAWSSISLAGRRGDDRWHVQNVERKRGTGWAPEKIVELMSKTDNVGYVVVDGRGPAASLIDDLEQRGLEVLTASAGDQAQACGFFYDAVVEETLTHSGQQELDAAVHGASSRPLGDAWAWSRKDSTADISPLVSSTLSLWGAKRFHEQPEEVWAAYA